MTRIEFTDVERDGDRIVLILKTRKGHIDCAVSYSLAAAQQLADAITETLREIKQELPTATVPPSSLQVQP